MSQYNKVMFYAKQYNKLRDAQQTNFVKTLGMNSKTLIASYN